jgi:hypothetical protein
MEIHMETEYAGIDYSLGQANVDTNGIHYGVIPHHEVGQFWYDESEPYYVYTCPYCGAELARGADSKRCGACHKRIKDAEDFDMLDPVSFTYEGDGYTLEQPYDDVDIWVFKSPYYSLSQYCSPCAPGAGYLLNPCAGGIRTYCLGHDWFEAGQAPYPVYRVDTGELVEL